MQGEQREASINTQACALAYDVKVIGYICLFFARLDSTESDDGADDFDDCY